MGAALETSLLLLLYQCVYGIVVVDMGVHTIFPTILGPSLAMWQPHGAQRRCESRKGEMMVSSSRVAASWHRRLDSRCVNILCLGPVNEYVKWELNCVICMFYHDQLAFSPDLHSIKEPQASNACWVRVFVPERDRPPPLPPPPER